jgi:transposase
MYSLIRSARLNDIDPRAYLHYVIEHIPDHAINRIDELARWVVADQLRSLKNHDL